MIYIHAAGLYSLAKRVEALGGTYGVLKRSNGKQGSCFWFTVPYRQDLLTDFEKSDCERSFNPSARTKYQHANTSIDGVEVTTLSAALPEPHVVVQLNILLVDDSLSIQKMCGMMLRRQGKSHVCGMYFMCNLLVHPGHTVTFAENGADALEMMSAQYIV